jgi:hypothetical protein
MPKLVVTLAGLLGAAMVANGVFMLVDPEAWYFAVPGVAAAGLFNQHFIRDIGIIELFIGAAYAVGIWKPTQRLGLWGIPTLWLTAHAIFHLWEVAFGICGPSVIPRDFPAVTLPALIGIGLTIWAWQNTTRLTANIFDLLKCGIP